MTTAPNTGDPASDDTTGLSDEKQTDKDTSYSPASEDETAAKQNDPVPAGVDDVARNVTVTPGTGGPDDSGDVDVDGDDVTIPRDPHGIH